MKLKIYSLLLLAGVLFFSCSDLDIPPRNIFGADKIYGSTDGVNTQLARIYGLLPMEDFRYSYVQNDLFNKTGTYQQMSCLTGEAMGRDTKGAEKEGTFWNGPYTALYEVNSFIQNINIYASRHKASDVKTWIAEARFARAFIYFSLAKRYGGVVLLDAPMNFDGGAESTQLPRNSEEETWNFIKADLDAAILDLPETSWKGRANKYVAAALQSRAMLFAGTIAKYTTVAMQYTKNGVMLCGIPAAKANDYFKAAYDASMLFEEGAGKTNYALYVKDFGSNPTAATIATNFGNIFLNADTSSETILARYYATGMSVHNLNEHAQPFQTKSGGGSDEICPTVDFIEMFDGLPKNADGTLNTLDADGNYIFYTSPLDFFATAEPRLAATVIFPGASFKGQTIEIRRGVYIGSVTGGLKPISPVGHLDYYSSLAIAADGAGKTLYLGGMGSTATVQGQTFAITGKSGMANGWDWGCISGMYMRKWLSTTANATTSGNVSTNTWIEIRLAEVYLNRAEAAMELAVSGDAQAATYRAAAFACIDGIRQRAGATRSGSASTLTVNDVRKERRKELAFENKAYWDLRRWRILHDEQNNKIYRALQPFIAAQASNKYFLDVHFQEPRSGNYSYNYDTKYYYQPIPNAEILKNPNCEQNNGY